MSENAKKHLVVQRLEQVFKGRRNSFSKPNQLQQQQEISQLAALADRIETEARGQQIHDEGPREATILSHYSDFPTAQAERPASSSQQDQLHTRELARQNDAAPNQRPTRPLDLDPSRAQHPTENIKYIKHLGFGLSRVDTGSDFQEGRGWAPFNLLINMAQLHIFNVTHSFVRTAVIELSHKFELSADGRNIRGKGGCKGTSMLSADNDGTEPSFDSSSDGSGLSSSMNGVGTAMVAGDTPSVAGGFHTQGFSSPSNGAKKSCQHMLTDYGCSKHHHPHRSAPYRSIGSDDHDAYTQRHKSVEKLTCNDDHSYGSVFEDVDEEIHGPWRFETLNVPEPIIFYSAECFCTDLSRDTTIPPYKFFEHKIDMHSILGLSSPRSRCEDHFKRGPVSTRTRSRDRQTINTTGTCAAFDIQWPMPSTPRSTPTCSPRRLAASGLGGVRLEDNFTLHVQTDRLTTPCRRAIQYLSVQRRVHKPAALPPPSYAINSHSASSSDVEDDEAVSEVKGFSSGRLHPRQSFTHPPPPTCPRTPSTVAANTFTHGSDDLSASTSPSSYVGRVGPIGLMFQEGGYPTSIVSNSANAIRTASSVVATAGGVSTVDESVPNSKGDQVVSEDLSRWLVKDPEATHHGESMKT